VSGVREASRVPVRSQIVPRGTIVIAATGVDGDLRRIMEI
jgi:hypothetical protein